MNIYMKPDRHILSLHPAIAIRPPGKTFGKAGASAVKRRQPSSSMVKGFTNKKRYLNYMTTTDTIAIRTTAWLGAPKWNEGGWPAARTNLSKSRSVSWCNGGPGASRSNQIKPKKWRQAAAGLCACCTPNQGYASGCQRMPAFPQIQNSELKIP